MKKSISVIALSLFVLAFAGCAKDKKKEDMRSGKNHHHMKKDLVKKEQKNKKCYRHKKKNCKSCDQKMM